VAKTVPLPVHDEEAAADPFEDLPHHADVSGRNGAGRDGDRDGDDGSDGSDGEAADPFGATGAADDEALDPEDLPESLRATSPLLSRAFRATGPQRSVLSQMLLDQGD
jgi:hypothetical protein